MRRQSSKQVQPLEIPSTQTGASSTASSALAAALSLGTLKFTSQNVKPARLILTAHHLFYLLSQFEDNGISVGPMNVRIENLQAEASPSNYVSFLSQPQHSRGRSDRDSIRSTSSVRSVISTMSALWTFGFGSSKGSAKSEKAQAQLISDLKYLYSAFTKIPCLRLSPDPKARLIHGYEEFPFDTAVPLLAFKNLSALEICDIDFRKFFGWDRLAEQLRSLTLKRASIEDPAEILTGVVLDDMERRRRRSSKTQHSPVLSWPLSPPPRFADIARGGVSAPPTPAVVEDRVSQGESPRHDNKYINDLGASGHPQRLRNPSTSPSRPTSSRQDALQRQNRGNNAKVRRSGSSSSTSSVHSTRPYRTGSSSNLLSVGILPASKWRFLRHLSLSDNSITSIPPSSLAPLANSIHSLDLSYNLLTEIPDSLKDMVLLKALNISHCLIGSLRSLNKDPMPAITALNLRGNRLESIAGVERLLSLERLDLRDNKIADPTEMARLTGLPDFRELWILRNPLTKTHSSTYRVKVFNLFRNHPGFLEDIMIDATGPGYNERRHLNDRVREPEAAPVVKTYGADGISVDQEIKAEQFRESIKKEPQEAADLAGESRSQVRDRSDGSQSGRAPHDNPASDAGVNPANASLRKKGAKKQRIVELTARTPAPVQWRLSDDDSSKRDEYINPLSGMNRSQTEELPVPRKQSNGTWSTRSAAVAPSSDQLMPELSDKAQPFADQAPTRLGAEAYRKKIEALKSQAGSEWLSLMTNDSWDEGKQEVKTKLP